jgi:predicted acetyltransferase
VTTSPGPVLRPVAEDQWGIVGWLWQAYRADLSAVVHGLPYADGRFAHGPLDAYPAADRAGWLAWAVHPNTGAPAPAGFGLVSGIGGAARTIDAFWVAAAARRSGVGRRLAVDLLGRYPRPWTIAFQHDNATAGHFWRAVATDAGGTAWTEEERPVRDRPDVPADHWITTTA